MRSNCVFCNNNNETTSHIFANCLVITLIWDFCRNRDHFVLGQTVWRKKRVKRDVMGYVYDDIDLGHLNCNTILEFSP